MKRLTLWFTLLCLAALGLLWVLFHAYFAHASTHQFKVYSSPVKYSPSPQNYNPRKADPEKLKAFLEDQIP